MIILEEIKAQAGSAARELVRAARLTGGQLAVVGCSTSEIAGKRVGTSGSAELGRAVFEAINSVFEEYGIYLAAQCCEHLNRSLIIERAAAGHLEIVNVVPKPDAGGAFAFSAYEGFKAPVAVENICADAGLDIGGTLIGMHLKRVAVPLRLELTYIGEAPVSAARTRPKYVGGPRAIYDENLF